MVLLLIALVAGIIVPNFRNFTMGQSNKFVAGQFLAQARYARTQAMTEGKTYRLMVDSNANAFWLTADNGGGTFEDVKADLGQRVTLPEGVTVRTDLPQHDDAAGTFVEFKGNGLTDAGRVTFTNKLGGEVTVACDSVTELYHVLPEGAR